MSVGQIKIELEKLTKKDLEKLLIDLYKHNKQTTEYLDTKFNVTSENNLMEKYRNIIKNEFFPDKGEAELRYSVMNKAFNDFKKITINIDFIIDLKLFQVENGIMFTKEYGDIDERFYNNIENFYHEALTLILKNNLRKKYEDRCQMIQINSQGFGWGFSDAMFDTFYAFYDYL